MSALLAAWQAHDAALLHAVACAAAGDPCAWALALHEWGILGQLRIRAGCVA